MSKITKQHAHIAAAYEYKLVDKEGKQFNIEGVYSHFICLWDAEGLEHGDIKFEQIGTEYFFLCRPLSDLVKEIDGKVPIVELANICAPELNWVVSDKVAASGGFHYKVVFYFDPKHGFIYGDSESPLHVNNQLALFQKLYEMHFDLFPEGCSKTFNDKLS
jgi:hypothetical protein